MGINKRKRNFIFLILIVLGITAGFKVYQIILEPNTKFKTLDYTIYIKTGATFSDVYKTIKPILKYPEHFELLAKLKKYPERVKAGRFVLKKDMGNNIIINRLVIGNTPIKLTFNNKHSLQILAGHIGKIIEPDSTQLIQAFTDPTFLEEKGFKPEEALIMYVPNTYNLYWNISATQFRERMYKEYLKFWNPKRLEKAKNINLDPSEVITLASIIEKETVNNDEKPIIAGVYINRLKNNWRLEACPPLIWLLNKKNPQKPVKRILYKDLEIPSPYNTYRNRGLPPGPISMPDISSIDAVLNYKKHDYFYFVADPEHFNHHKFSKNLKTHNNHKKKYTNWLKQHKIYR